MFNGAARQVYSQGTQEELSEEILNLKKEYYELKKLNSTLLLCINTLYDSNDSEDAINYLLATIAGYHGAESASIFELSDDKKHFINKFRWQAEEMTDDGTCIKSISARTLKRWTEHFEKDGEIYVETDGDIDKTSHEYEILIAEKIDSIIAVPLYKHGKLSGFIAVANPKNDFASLNLLKSIATFLVGDLERRKYMEQLYKLSYHDKMTGLKNRHAYIKKMEELEKNGRQNGGPDKKLGIIFVDINGLKEANDNFGHEKGDEMIVTTSTILKSICTTRSIQYNQSVPVDYQKGIEKTSIYRIGGDEFVVFMEDIPKNIFNQKVTEMQKHSIISVGSVYLEKCADIERHVVEADKNMYENKKQWHQVAKVQ